MQARTAAREPASGRWSLRPWAWLAAACVMLAALWAPAAMAGVEIGEAMFISRDTAQPPPAGDPGWHRVPLPHVWNHDEQRAQGGWYRLTLRLAKVPTLPQAVYLPQVHVNAALWLNGTWVGDGGRLEDPMSFHWNHPFLFALPPALLHAGDNELLLRVRAVGGFGLLSPAEVGDAEELRPRYERRRFWQAEVHGALALLLGSIAVLALGIWNWRRADDQYLWLGLSCLAWCGFAVFLYGRDFPLDPLFMQWLAQAGTIWWVTCLAHYVHRQTRGPRPRTERTLLATALLFNAVSLALPPLARVHVYSAAHVVMLGVLAYLIGHAWRHGRATGKRASLGLALVCLLVLLGGIHDVVITMPVQWSSMAFVRELARHRYYLTPYGAPLASVLIGLHLARRFVATLSNYEALNADLERRVEESRQALARHFDANRARERAQAAGDERERIVREMHDGIGGQLMTALRGVERGVFDNDRIAAVLQDSLDDLRLLIDASAASSQLLPALATWRHRWDPRLEALGVAMSWEVDEGLAAVALPPDVVLQLMRILQEAVANTLKHARASEVSVKALRTAAGMLRLQVSDNGVGLPEGEAAPSTPGHHGLASMRARARAIGAQIEIRRVAAGGGTRVEVELASPAVAQPA